MDLRGFWEVGMTTYIDVEGKTWDVDPRTGIYYGEGGKLYKAGSTAPLKERFTEVTEDAEGNKKYVVKDKNGRIYKSGLIENTDKK